MTIWEGFWKKRNIFNPHLMTIRDGEPKKDGKIWRPSDDNKGGPKIGKIHPPSADNKEGIQKNWKNLTTTWWQWEKIKDSFFGWWRNRLTTQKNDRWWWTKESIKSRRSGSRQELNYLRLQTRPLSIPAINASSPSSWSETKKEYRKSLLCFIMTVWFTQNFIECPKKELDLLRPNRSLKEGVSPTPPTIADAHTRPHTGCFYHRQLI